MARVAALLLVAALVAFSHAAVVDLTPSNFDSVRDAGRARGGPWSRLLT